VSSSLVTPKLLMYYFLPSVSRIPKGLEKIDENCRSDHYSGQFSNTKESCSSTPLNRCTSTETHWNNKICLSLVAGMMTNFLRQKWEKVKGRLINWAESLDRNWLKKVVCCKTRLFNEIHTCLIQVLFFCRNLQHIITNITEQRLILALADSKITNNRNSSTVIHSTSFSPQVIISGKVLSPISSPS